MENIQIEEKHLKLLKTWEDLKSKFCFGLSVYSRDMGASYQLKKFERENIVDLLSICKFNEKKVNIISSPFHSVSVFLYKKIVKNEMTHDDFIIALHKHDMCPFN